MEESDYNWPQVSAFSAIIYQIFLSFETTNK